jgi:hypothetical protein
MSSLSRKCCLSFFAGCIAVLALAASTGCQTSIAGQTLPSAYFLQDDVQYFVKGPQHKLHREAAALQEARAEAMGRR